MLFDPKWAKPETKADPLELSTLIAWLEKQPAKHSYGYICNGTCLLAQYFTACGLGRVSVGCFSFSHGEDRRPLPAGFNKIAIERPRTYGAALKRARALAAQQS